MNIKKDYTYAMVVPTSMGVRIQPYFRQPTSITDLFRLQVTSAETNVASISASLGLPVKVLTTFVKGSPIAKIIKADLGRRGMVYEGPEVEQGGPWGYRHQFNIADAGFGGRAPRVVNDRAGEVGRTLNIKDFDVERIFGKEGVGILHLSGLIAALSPETSKFCLELARAAKKYGTVISFDLNYRASFWENREEELRQCFDEIASVSDVLVGNEEDFQLALGITGPEAGGKDLASKIDSFKGMILNAKAKYPNVTTFANTLRQAINANEHLWGAILYDNDQWYVIDPRPIQVVDRLGGGDAFVGGLLYGNLRGWDAEKCIQFGWATGAFVATLMDDFCLPQDEEQVWGIWEGNARIKR